MSNFINSIINGAGREVGRSTARAFLNPLLKGADSQPISVDTSFSSKNIILIDEKTIQTTKVETKLYTIILFIFGIIFCSIPFLGILGIFISLNEGKTKKKSILKLMLDAPYYKIDKRTKSGFRVNETANIIKTEIFKNHQSDWYKAYYILAAYALIIQIILMIIIF